MSGRPPSIVHARACENMLEWSRPEWIARFAAAGIKSIHAESAWGEIHRRFARSLRDAACLPEKARGRLNELPWQIGEPEIVREVGSSDGFTRKFLLRMEDDETIETVLMRFRRRTTACLSTQAGCAMGCVFCATGQAGFRRHLSTGEIVAQALTVGRMLRESGERLRNIVLMGQGEPLHNYDATLRAVEILIDEKGMALAGDRITLSTVGHVPGIRRLAAESRPCSLAVSLHGAHDDERAGLVPVARRWPLAELMDACREYTARTGRRIFFEWTLIKGRNDSVRAARDLGRLLAGQRAHVNLIPLNPTEGFDGIATVPASARAFQEALREHGIPSTIRQRRGIDIAAGCGQLAALS